MDLESAISVFRLQSILDRSADSITAQASGELERLFDLPLKNICANLCKIRRHAVLTTSRRILTDLSKLPEGIDSSR